MNDPVQQTFYRLFGPEFGHGKAFDLAHLRAALAALGNPQDKLPPIIHVAGTNGKGSTIAFMRAVAEAAGLRVHAFTKPHLFKLNERFVVAGAYVSDEALIAAAERIAAISRDLTQFDAQVAAAFLLFSETPADLVLLETGMGGRDDSTNVISTTKLGVPAVTIITPIGLDHQDALGPTLAEIATHKAGVIRRIVTTIVARQEPEAMAALQARAKGVQGDLRVQGLHWDAFENNGSLIVQTTDLLMHLPLPKLQGRHQVENAGLACIALLSWRADWPAGAFANGVANATWPARLQPLTRGPLSAPIRAIGGEVWVDGGHNAHALAALRNWAIAADAQRKAPLVVIFAARPRKNWAMALKFLAIKAERVIAVPMHDGVDPQQIAAYASSEGTPSTTAPSLAAAMQNAAQFPAPRVLICGSFLLAAEALAAERA